MNSNLKYNSASSDASTTNKGSGLANTINKAFEKLSMKSASSVDLTSTLDVQVDSKESKQSKISKRKSATLSTKKKKSMQRPKSALPPPKPSKSQLFVNSSPITSNKAGDLIPTLGRYPSTPSLRFKSDENSTSQSDKNSTSQSDENSTSQYSNKNSEKDLDITAFLAAPRLTQRVRLKNGRVVSFSEVGDRNGFPVFIFLGMGCVRYFIAFFDDLASSYGLRLICPDRPGVGLSDDVKTEDQHVLKWPEVIEELCEILNVDKFFIMAHSAGAPYALACAKMIPERLAGTIYLVCPWISTTVANNFKWLRYVPTPIIKLTNSAGISLQQMLHGRQPYSTKPQKNSGALSSQMSSLEKKQQLGLAILKASFAENLSGANNDLLMCFERRHSFGYSYTDIEHPVHVFHGTKDERIPVSAVKWMEESMPNCKLTLIEGGKHSLLLRAEIVDTIFKTIAVQLHVKDECRVCKLSTKCWLMEESRYLKANKELL
ncbi:5441_t:CDS:2 [Diversispora eburnea]|uniref:5441_t:CDS:1 n=1 Tax=Diversispora eburnea TaxID=1213867 RepID=A0A9N9A7M8_9GLOM|nr:5441_t:CDS:2 [Diversispora eburnea]